jgi:lipopolysaccharide transport protein LptA
MRKSSEKTISTNEARGRARRFFSFFLYLSVCAVLMLPALAVAQADFDLGGTFEGPVDLTGDSFSYEMVGDQPSKLVVTGNVNLKTEEFTLKCKKLVYNSDKGEMLATGAPAHMTQKGVQAQADKLYYYPKEKKLILRENAQIQQSTKDGAPGAIIKGEPITIIQRPGGVQVIVDSRGKQARFKSGGSTGQSVETKEAATIDVPPSSPKEEPKRASETRSKEPERITSSKLSKIPEVSFDNGE